MRLSRAGVRTVAIASTAALLIAGLLFGGFVETYALLSRGKTMAAPYAHTAIAVDLVWRCLLVLASARFIAGICTARNSRAPADEILDAVMQSAPFGILYMDSHFKILTANDAFTAVTGLKQKETVGRSLQDIARTLGLEHLDAGAGPDLWTGGEAGHSEDIAVQRSEIGETRQILVSLSAHRTGSGRIMGYALFAEDITSRMRSEKYTALADRLNLIAEFAASTAHEIRNPLTTLRGFLQLQRRRNPAAAGKDHLQIMIEEIDRVNGLISEYLNLSRGAVNSGHEEIDLSDVIAELLPLAAAEANMRGVVVNVGNLPARAVSGKKSELKQVFLNLIKNALDAMPSGGELSISGEVKADVYEIRFSDTGEGIPPENVQKIFQPFFTTKASGSGLGLSISQKIVDNHRGTLHVSSEQGKGSTFLVSLPLTLPTPPPGMAE